MQITLNQQEIEKAIINYVGQQGIAITGKNVSVSLSAGRGENRMSATIEISNDEVAAKCRGPVSVVEPEDDTQMSLPFEAAAEEAPESPATELAEKPLFGI